MRGRGGLKEGAGPCDCGGGEGGRSVVVGEGRAVEGEKRN